MIETSGLSEVIVIYLPMPGKILQIRVASFFQSPVHGLCLLEGQADNLADGANLF
jgi:hypothetical protein